MSVTIQDVADRCRLSRETVNHILRGRGAKYRPETRERVLAAAGELGYRPNSAARAMRLGSFRSIGLVSASERGVGALDAGLLLGIQGAAGTDLHISIGQVDDGAFTSPDGLPRIVGEWSCDGLLLNYVAAFPSAVRELLERSGIPAVWLNVRHESDCIHPDDHGAAAEAVRRMAAVGHRRIAYLSCTGGEHYSRDDRREGYLAAMRTAGLQPIVHEQPISGGGAALGAAVGAALDGRPSALLCYSAGEAIPAAYAAAVRGLAIPRDLSLVCLGPAGTEGLGIAVAHARPDFHAMGRAAVDLLRRRIARPRASIPTVIHPFTWSEGATLAPPAP